MSFFSEDQIEQTEQVNQDFSGVIDILKSRNALPNESHPQHIPFFNLNPISIESQTKELFQSRNDISNYNAALNNIMAKLNTKNAATSPEPQTYPQSMNFAQIVLYKVLPCSGQQCDRCPREVVTHNQYKDLEYSCPFYHHEKDRRRLVIGSHLNEEFEYKANYFDERRPTGNREKYSQNFFESMFHPLYYKMFKCRRGGCNAYEFCPFFHNEEERLTWDHLFGSFMGKDRVSYVKDKQKFYESSPSTIRTESQESSSPESLDKDDQYQKRQSICSKDFGQRGIKVNYGWKTKKLDQHPLKKWKQDKMHMFNAMEKSKN